MYSLKGDFERRMTSYPIETQFARLQNDLLIAGMSSDRSRLTLQVILHFFFYYRVDPAFHFQAWSLAINYESM